MKKVKFVLAIAIAVAVMMTLSACSLFGDSREKYCSHKGVYRKPIKAR